MASLTDEQSARLADALLGAEEILETLHMRGTKGLERESCAGRVADVFYKVRDCKQLLPALDKCECGLLLDHASDCLDNDYDD